MKSDSSALQYIKLGFISACRSIEEVPQFAFWMNEQSAQALLQEIALYYLENQLIFSYLHRCTKTPFVIPSEPLCGEVNTTFGFGGCGHILCRETEIFFLIDIEGKIEKNISLTCFVMFEVLKQLHAKGYKVPFKLQCVYANQKRGYAVSGRVTLWKEWFKEGAFSSPAIIAILVRNAMHETWCRITGTPPKLGQHFFSSHFNDDGSFTFSFLSNGKKLEVTNISPFDKKSEVMFTSTNVNSPEELTILLSGVLMLCSFT